MRPKRIILNVKQEHIDNGSRMDGKECALSLALRGRGYVAVFVDHTHAVFCDPKTDKLSSFRLSPGATNFIQAFDIGRKVKPAKFTLVEVV